MDNDVTDAAIALDRLHISEDTEIDIDDATESPSPAASSSLLASPESNTIRDCKPDASVPIILCDAFYGFPTQKRPRNERVRAVSRQLTNFLQWRSETSKENSIKATTYVLGDGKDVASVKTRVDELGTQTRASTNEIIFHPDIKIQQFLDQQKDALSIQESKEEVVYLSPDASYTLPVTCRPPRVVIIGMLIDRRITEDRSRRRAEESLKIQAAKLPLDELCVRELSSCEPLNVDTVMELIQRWWWNCDKLEQRLQQRKNNDSGNTGRFYKKCFIEAAAFAMKSQRDRHPNRTVHKTD